LSANRLAPLAKHARLPHGEFNQVTRYLHDATQALSDHNDIEAIAFTGSTSTGTLLLKDWGESKMKRCLIYTSDGADEEN
ncbi:aldehyde dehydrogenase family protein, partial [Escherichia coli]